jgi:hypothetical protein
MVLDPGLSDGRKAMLPQLVDELLQQSDGPGAEVLTERGLADYFGRLEEADHLFLLRS